VKNRYTFRYKMLPMYRAAYARAYVGIPGKPDCTLTIFTSKIHNICFQRKHYVLSNAFLNCGLYLEIFLTSSKRKNCRVEPSDISPDDHRSFLSRIIYPCLEGGYISVYKNHYHTLPPIRHANQKSGLNGILDIYFLATRFVYRDSHWIVG